MSLGQRFSRGVAWMSVGVWVEQAFNFIIIAILARLLGAEAFGLLAMAAAFVLFSEFLVRESISDILLTRDELSPARLNSVFWLLALLGAVLMAVLFLAAGPVARFYGEDVVQGLLIGLSPTVMMIALTAVPVAILRRKMEFRVLALRAIAGAVIGGIVGIGMALAGYGVWALVGQRLALTATNIVMAWGAVSWRPGLSVSRKHIREILHFGHRILGLRAAELAAVQSPVVIIGALMGPVQAGYYAIAWRVVEVAFFVLITPLRMVAQPAFGAAARGGGRATDLLLDVMRLTGFLAFPAFAGLAILSEPVLVLLFGQKWSPAAPVLSLMAVFGMYLSAEKVQQTFCLAAGRPGRLAILSWIEVGLAVVVIAVVAPYGLSLTTAGFVAVFLLIWPFKFANLGHIVGLPGMELMRQHVVPLLLSAGMAASVQGVAWQLDGKSPALILLVGTAAGIAVYCLLAALFQRNRLRLLFSMVRSHGEIDTREVGG
ncbi:lipopolysaccharide biosynthesis protein [Ruegeria lacuscaerulensis]|uniref:lipopolysaccharide biosynthesis protein n=1 Tax=Ruegeria lacuscaerulensis TaxID=55218 RepID=UPI001481B400|nr:lipopolysaccharide biosynthesis protein [Ruegeria lacuscaerulensis]